jgi:hypothetical protein
MKYYTKITCHLFRGQKKLKIKKGDEKQKIKNLPFCKAAPEKPSIHLFYTF